MFVFLQLMFLSFGIPLKSLNYTADWFFVCKIELRNNSVFFFRQSAKQPKEVFDNEYHIEDISAGGMYRVPSFFVIPYILFHGTAINSFFGCFFPFKNIYLLVLLNK